MLKHAEKETGDFYARISSDLKEKYPEVSDLFSELSEEEMVHMSWFEMLRNFQVSAGNAFVHSPDAVNLAENFFVLLRNKKKEYSARSARMTPWEIIAMALEIESHMVEQHKEFFIKVQDPQFQKLFENLNFGTEKHIMRLSDFFPRRFPPPQELPE